MTYEESAALMTDLPFRNRIMVACLNFANYIIDEIESTPAHNTRMKWAQSVYQSPAMVAAQIQPPTVMDAKVQEFGSDITDPDLQSSVETTVNKLL
jgi:hypothetical protein